MQTIKLFLRKIQICTQHFASSSKGTLDLRGRHPLSSGQGGGVLWPSLMPGALQKRVGRPLAQIGGFSLLTEEAGIGALGFLGMDHVCGKVPCLVGLYNRDMEGGLPQHPSGTGWAQWSFSL